MQPLTVTRKEIQKEDGTFYTEYELIAGERRLRASKLAGLSQVPVIIREGEDSEQEKLELAIIENLQREDLNAVDRALAFRQLADVFGLSHTQVAKKVGRSREYVSNSIRLLALPDYMLSALRQAEMTEGHARTLLMLNDRPEEQDVVFREILMKKLSVREVERIVRKIATDKVRKKNPGEFDAELIEIEKKFMETLGTRVQIQKTDYGGRLTIDYFSVDDLEGMLTRMKVEQSVATPAAAAMATLTTHTPLEVAEDDTGREAADVTDEEVLSEVPVEPAPAPTPMSSYAPTFTPQPVAEHQPMPTPEPVQRPVEPPAYAPAPVQQYTPAPVPAEPLPHDVQPYAAPAVPNPYMAERDVMVPPVVEAPAPVVPPPTLEPTPKEEDESNLYSMRNFGV